MAKAVFVAVVVSSALMLQGCLATAVGTAAGVAVGATGMVVKGTVKGAGAVGRAVIPGDSDD